MSREITLPLDEILSLVSCAEDYGHTTDVLMTTLAGWLDFTCSDQEIDAYANWFVSPDAVKQGYGEEDKENIRERLIEWRNEYCKPKGS